MFKSLLNSIVGDDTPAVKPADPSRPPSQPPSGRSSPMSESGSFSFAGRRGSSSSCHSLIAPVDQPDLSHLSEQERSQIEAVIARAREMQQEGDQRVRDIEKDFGKPVHEEKPKATKALSEKIVPTQCAAEVHLSASRTLPHQSKSKSPVQSTPLMSNNVVQSNMPKQTPVNEAAKRDQSVCIQCSGTRLTVDCSKCNSCQAYVCKNCIAATGGKTPQKKEWLCAKCAKKKQGQTALIHQYKETGSFPDHGSLSGKPEAEKKAAQQSQAASKTRKDNEKRHSNEADGNTNKKASKESTKNASSHRSGDNMSVATEVKEKAMQQDSAFHQNFPVPSSLPRSKQPKDGAVRLSSGEQTSANDSLSARAPFSKQEPNAKQTHHSCAEQTIGARRAKPESYSQPTADRKGETRHDLPHDQNIDSRDREHISTPQGKEQYSHNKFTPTFSQAPRGYPGVSGEQAEQFDNRSPTKYSNSLPTTSVQHSRRQPAFGTAAQESSDHLSSPQHATALTSGSAAHESRAQAAISGGSQPSLENRSLTPRPAVGAAPNSGSTQQTDSQWIPHYGKTRGQADAPVTSQQTMNNQSLSHKSQSMPTCSVTHEIRGHPPVTNEPQDSLNHQPIHQPATRFLPTGRALPEASGHPDVAGDTHKSPDHRSIQPVHDPRETSQNGSTGNNSVRDTSVKDIHKEEAAGRQLTDKHELAQKHHALHSSTAQQNVGHFSKKRESGVGEDYDKQGVSTAAPQFSTEPDVKSPDQRKSPRPNNLAISPKSPPLSLALTENIQYLNESHTSPQKEIDIKPDNQGQVRTVGEGAETPNKKKPSPLDRVGLNKSYEDRSPQDRRRSPSRVSPRSPPRSPSWMRYKDSPPRSPGMLILSPTKSPTERFPSTYSEMPHGERQGTYGEEEFTFPDTIGDLQSDKDIYDSYESDKPPPKPARMSAVHVDVSRSKTEANSMDLASYAATVASSTAHLTSMSVSPTNQIIQSTAHTSHELENELISPPSPNYFEELEGIDPSTKSIDCQNTKRQKVKPPATDWSPITDLSPILDVSPSLEKIEQEKMFAEQETEQEKMYSGAEIMSTSDTKIIAGNYHMEASRNSEHNFDSSKPNSRVNLGLIDHEQTHQLMMNQYPKDRVLNSDAIYSDSKDEEASHYHFHHSFEGDPEIDLDDDIPPQKRVINIDKSLLINSDDPLPEEDQDLPFERQGGLVRSKVRFFSQSVNESCDQSKPKSLSDDDISIVSPRYQVLASPQSPEDSPAGNSTDKNRTEQENPVKKEFPYASPLPTPERQRSPPRPASPSDKRLIRNVTKVTRSRSLDNPARDAAAFDRKSKRKLPPVPSEQDVRSTSAKTQRSQNNGDSQVSRVSSLKQDKELLRKHLKQKEAERIGKVNKSVEKVTNPSKTVVESKILNKPSPEKRVDVSKPKPPQTLPKPRVKPGPPVAPKPQRSKAKKPVIETVNIYGIDVPIDVRSMKKRIKEEIQIVTATRRLKIDEMEEVRIMERELADREKKRKMTLEIQARNKAKQKAQEEKERERLKKLEEEIKKQRDQEKLIEKERLDAEEILMARAHPKINADETPGNKLSVTGNDSINTQSQVPARKGKHKRQNSDPILSKFSPIEEKDFETDASYRLGMEARRLGNSFNMTYSPQPVRRGLRSGNADLASQYTDRVVVGNPLRTSGRSKSSEILYLVDKDERLNAQPAFLNEPLSRSHKSKSQYSGIDEMNDKDEKRYLLQIEIDKRRQALEENARLRREIQKLTEAANIGPYEFALAKTKYQEHMSSQGKFTDARIIRPLDHEQIKPHQMVQSEQFLDKLDSKQAASGVREFPPCNYSSTEYLSHRSTPPNQQIYDRAEPYFRQQSMDFGGNAVFPNGQTNLDYLRSLSAGGLLGMYDNVGSGSPYHRPDIDFYKLNNIGTGLDTQSETSIATDTTVTSLKDNTPSMPILDDVTMRSRTKLRQIGSRPLSDDFGEYIIGQDPLAALLRTESEHSVAESDDHIMEGGITIKERKDIKKMQSSDTMRRGRYDFSTKCILLTKDPKERSVQGRKQGNGIGMKIVGGKIIPGTDEVGAYVSAIYPGGVADQLHGELQEGDQVLEWNGISLTGKTYEEVQHIISQPNGEIELVVRPGTRITCKDPTMSTLSAHSSYDNLESTSDYEEFDGKIVDPRANTAQGRQPSQQTSPFKTLNKPENTNIVITTTDASKEGGMVRNITGPEPFRTAHGPGEHHISPGASPSSSQHDIYLSPSASISGSSESNQSSHIIELPNLGADPESYNRDPHDWGELQLQLSYDDYDGTLNIHVMQAKSLKPKDRNGLSDPFVKCYLLPGRIGENKRRTKIITRCLDPEWHQTLVFMKISKDELKAKTLEVTVWDYDRFKPNDFLGEVFLDLGDRYILDNKPHWYKLHEHDERLANRLSKVIPYSHGANSNRNILTKPEGHSRPLDEPPPNHSEALMNVKPSAAHKDLRTLQPEHRQTGAKYSPGLGRRKDVIKQDRMNKRTSEGFPALS